MVKHGEIQEFWLRASADTRRTQGWDDHGWSGWYHTFSQVLHLKPRLCCSKNPWPNTEKMHEKDEIIWWSYIYIYTVYIPVDSFYGQVIQRKEVGRFGLRPSLGEKRKVWTSAIHNSLGKSNPFGKKHNASPCGVFVQEKRHTQTHTYRLYIYIRIILLFILLVIIHSVIMTIIIVIAMFDFFGVLRCFESSGWPATRGGIPSYDCAIWADLGFPASQVSQIS